jgi:pyruvate dehydrogenase E2 component (dihydrolipoamide acetyltransferase)/2-oxoisovalerate dehydrogenase E2 component (dihydrolipoyl transacylase)
MEVPAPFAGTVSGLRAQPGDMLKIGQPILSYEGDNKEVPATPADSSPRPTESPSGTPAPRSPNGPAAPSKPRDERSESRGLPVQAAPSVRQLAHKLGIDLGLVRGSGPHGRILIEDLSNHVSTPSAGDGARPKKEAPPPFDFGKPGTRVKLLGVRRKIAEHMVQAKRVIPHYSYIDECDVTDLVKLRDMVREPFAEKGAKLTYLAFFVKAVVGALKEIPIVNASLDETAGEIVLHDHYHVGIAVAAPAGLMVPVIRDADKLSLLDTARAIERLTSEVRANKSKIEDLRGGTFTITSIGGLGGLFATPIINHPQVGILGIGKIVKRPVFDEHGQVRPADMVYLSFSFDHRVLDGAIAASFGNALIRRLQRPAEMLIET